MYTCAMCRTRFTISKIFTNNLKKIMTFSILFGASFSLLGLFISYKIHIAFGVTKWLKGRAMSQTYK